METCKTGAMFIDQKAQARNVAQQKVEVPAPPNPPGSSWACPPKPASGSAMEPLQDDAPWNADSKIASVFLSSTSGTPIMECLCFVIC